MLLLVDPGWGTLFVSLCGGTFTLTAAYIAIKTAGKAKETADATHVLVNSNLLFIRRLLFGSICVIVLLVAAIVKLDGERGR